MDACKTGNIVVAQDHNIWGGLGSVIATVIAKESISTKFKILGLPDMFIAMAHAPYLYEKYEYNTEGLVKNMIKMTGI